MEVFGNPLYQHLQPAGPSLIAAQVRALASETSI
jgi:hypothetical protein